MNGEVGLKAGDVFHFLQENGEVTIKKLKDGVKSENGGSVEDLYTTLAIGWLLREDKLQVKVTPRGKSYSCVVSLKED